MVMEITLTVRKDLKLKIHQCFYHNGVFHRVFQLNLGKTTCNLTEYQLQVIYHDKVIISYFLEIL